MSENRLMKAWGQGCARSLALRIGVAVVVVTGFATAALLVALLPVPTDLKPMVWAGLVVTFMLVLVTGVLAWGVASIRQRGSELDQVFNPLGLQGRMYLQNGRQYHGSWRGFPFHVYFYRGPTLQIYLDVPLQTRLGVGRKGVVERVAADLLERQPLLVPDSEFAHLGVYPLDRQWGAALLADNRARQAILSLLEEDSATELRSLSIQPQSILWQSRYIPLKVITPEKALAWMDDLWELAWIAKELHPPTAVAAETNLERNSRQDRGKITRWAVIGTCGFLSLMTICILVITAALILLEESGI